MCKCIWPVRFLSMCMCMDMDMDMDIVYIHKYIYRHCVVNRSQAILKANTHHTYTILPPHIVIVYSLLCLLYLPGIWTAERVCMNEFSYPILCQLEWLREAVNRAWAHCFYSWKVKLNDIHIHRHANIHSAQHNTHHSYLWVCCAPVYRNSHLFRSLILSSLSLSLPIHHISSFFFFLFHFIRFVCLSFYSLNISVYVCCFPCNVLHYFLWWSWFSWLYIEPTLQKNYEWNFDDFFFLL